MAEKEEIVEIKEEKKSKKFRRRTIVVLIAIAIFLLCLAIQYRANYLEILEIGEEYIDVYTENFKYKAWIGISNFVFIFIITYITTRLIKRGLKVFFEEEKKDMPKLPNKSISLIFALIATVISPSLFLEKVIFFVNNSQFGIPPEPIFNMDIGFYMFQAPLIGFILYYLTAITIILTVYIAIYYIIVFNTYFDGINGQTLKNNIFIKHLLFNVKVIALLIAGIIIFSMQNIVLDRFININSTTETSLVGAGVLETTIKLWGYRILAVVMVISVFMAISYFKKSNSKNVIKSLAIVPVYLVGLFIVTVGYNILFVNGSELDKEKSYITTNIQYTQTAYNLKIEEEELDSTGTITREEAEKNENVINNIPIVTEKVALNNLLQTQTSTGYYTFNNPKVTLRNGKLVYVSAREISTQNITYNSKADEYTHGFGTILISASEVDENGNIVYLSKDFEDDTIEEPRIYYGVETNNIITVSGNQKEFDYPMTSAQNAMSIYEGNGGISLNFLDKLSLALKNRKLGILLSDSDSKVLLNRNITERAKKIMPYLIYDEKPYLVISDDNKLYWVLDAYTVSNEYPFSQKTKITYGEETREINYIRNSIKVIIDAYNGDTEFYITDKTDPIAMVYKNMYDTLFKEQNEIPRGISKYFTYPEFLYKIQAEMLTMYHDVSSDVLYRGNDIWQIASYSNAITTTASTEMEPLYTMLKTNDANESKLGLVLAYNLYGKENLNSYLVGTVEDGDNKLKIYKFSNDNSVVGPIQIDNMIEQNETISKEISSLNVTGTRISKEMTIVPINNTVLYVVPIYQTSLNEKNSVPVLKKVVVASGNKIAIGGNFSDALKNLLSVNYSVNIEVDDRRTVEGLINSIIKANNNLTESNNSNDWAQIGRDIEELQALIKELDTMMKNNEENNPNPEEDSSNTDITNTESQNIINN